MKRFLLSLFLYSSICAFSESIPRDIWIVKSDEKDRTVADNLCRITGNVYEAFSETGIQGGIISNLNRTKSCKTNENGDFTLTISSLDTAIFFYHESYVEIVCWKYDFKGGHHVVMDFICSERLPDGMMYMEEKPVIYAYSDKFISADLKLSNKDDLTFTYPKYENGWSIEVRPETTGLNIDNVNYPYLFWEGEKRGLNFISNDGSIEGYYVKTDTIIDFFERSLKSLGLNSIEQTDFITYWGPRLQQHDFATVQFLVDEDYASQIGELLVEPQPDALRRVYLLFEGDDSGEPIVSLKEPLQKSFIRTGFTIIEWGGTELNNPLDF